MPGKLLIRVTKNDGFENNEAAVNLHRPARLPILKMPHLSRVSLATTRRRGHVRYGNPA